MKKGNHRNYRHKKPHSESHIETSVHVKTNRLEMVRVIFFIIVISIFRCFVWRGVNANTMAKLQCFTIYGMCIKWPAFVCKLNRNANTTIHFHWNTSARAWQNVMFFHSFTIESEKKSMSQQRSRLLFLSFEQLVTWISVSLHEFGMLRKLFYDLPCPHRATLICPFLLFPYKVEWKTFHKIKSHFTYIEIAN